VYPRGLVQTDFPHVSGERAIEAALGQSVDPGQVVRPLTKFVRLPARSLSVPRFAELLLRSRAHDGERHLCREHARELQNHGDDRAFVLYRGRLVNPGSAPCYGGIARHGDQASPEIQLLKQRTGLRTSRAARAARHAFEARGAL